MAVRGPFKYGGLNTKTSTSAFGTASPTGNYLAVPAGQMTVCNDFNLMYGSLLGRPVTSIFSNRLGVSSQIWGLTSWVDPVNYSGGNYIFAVADDQKIYRAQWAYNQTGTAFTDVTGTASIGNTIGTGQWASLNGLLVGCFGGAVPFQITANNVNAANLAGSPPTGYALKVVNNFLFIGRQLNSSTTFSRVSWSNVNDPQTWSAGNFIDFRKNDGDRVMALGSIGTDLYIFKFNSIGRLSTSTLTISGAVTLGPLETVFLGVGAFTPNCVDNLPDGRIVFLGSDLHLYVFDGFTLNNLSDLPFPNPNIQRSLDELPTNASIWIGLKVYPSHNQIFVWQGTTGTNTRLYAYDYVENFWAQWTTLTPNILAVVPSYDFSVPSGGYFNISYSLIEGRGTGGTVVQLDTNNVLNGMGNDTSTTIGTATCTINVPLTGDLYDFLPRSLLLPIGNGTTTVAGVTNGLIVTFGWDGTFLSSASLTMQAGTIYPNTLVIPIPFTKEGTTSVRPMSLQIKISTQAGFLIHPFYLSDELLN